MNRREMLLSSGALALGMSAFPRGFIHADDGKRKRLLFFTKSSGFEHSVVHRNKPDELSYAEKIVTELGQKHGFDVHATKDGRVFIPEEIAKFDAFCFYTTEDLTKEGNDKNPPMPPEGKKAFLEAIANGKGFIGSHCASDTFHSPGNRGANQPAGERDPYTNMIGGEFIIHGKQQKAWMRNVGPDFPGAKDIKDFQLHEEWYALKNFAPDLYVILAQDSQGMEGKEYQRDLFPATWARKHGKGRVFYTSMGHREDVWVNPTFQQLLLGGIAWALGNVAVEFTPNIEKVTPKAMELGK